MQRYLFVHFRETTSPEGEQVYFSLSRDAFTWEALNNGQPILWAYYGDHGVRDMTAVRDKRTGGVHIFATDLSLSYGMRGKYAHSWKNITTHGSKDLAHWYSDDLIHWSEEELIRVGQEDFGCVWAPDVLYDPGTGDYILHWSSSHARDGYRRMAIWYSRTKDFASWTEPKILYQKADAGVIDSAMYEENGRYYLFVKSDHAPSRVILLTSAHATGPFERHLAFDESMEGIAEGLYEAPTAVRTEDGKWCLFLDYYGARGAGQGYVPFVSESLEEGRFVRSDNRFSFPFGFKHGTILPITEEEYDRMKARDWSMMPDGR
ncbi:MAG: glycoside hydrolase family 43 protein [Clostridia bacterium]|nr:glycoside hydrolase family 43 protein [Clostridia bacterium]